MNDQPLPVIYISTKRTIYLGRSYHLPLREVNSGATWLLTCLEGCIKFRVSSSNQWVTAKSLLISAGTKISIDNKDAIISVCYLDPSQADYQAIKINMRSVNNGVYYNYQYENQLISDLTMLRDTAPTFDEAQVQMENIIYAHVDKRQDKFQVDPRIQHVIYRLKKTAELNIPVKDFAKEVAISESGLIKLFRKNVGTPIRKHRLWYRLLNFITYKVAGKSTAEAISLTGFSDISHLSKCYSSLFGIPFSVAFAQPATMRCIVSDTELKKASMTRTLPQAMVS